MQRRAPRPTQITGAAPRCPHTPVVITFTARGGPVVRRACPLCDWSYWEAAGQPISMEDAVGVIDLNAKPSPVGH